MQFFNFLKSIYKILNYITSLTVILYEIEFETLTWIKLF
jgi:hypothetical protein